MFQPSDAGQVDVGGDVQPALFNLARTDTDPPDAAGRWVYPCGLCGTVEVTDDGGICTACTPVPVRKPNRTRKTIKTIKTTAAKRSARTSTKPVRSSRPAEGGGGR